VGYPRSLGLENYVLTQGLASKLFVPPATTNQRDTVYVQGDGWFDIARSYALWSDVFGGHKSVIREGQWVDRPSVSLPAMYIFSGAELADALRSVGKTAEANAVFAKTKDVAKATGLSDLIRPVEAAYSAPAAGDSVAGVPLRLNTENQPRVRSSDPTVGKKKLP
jgi:hypothetical protein